MKLRVLDREDCEQVRLWRNEDLVSWRTPYYLTKEMQEGFYENVVCNRNSPHRYWGMVLDSEDGTGTFQSPLIRRPLIGSGGITNIQWENSIGEITLTIDPEMAGKGYGKKAVDLLLGQAFNFMGLKTVFGECYESNEAGCSFWKKIVTRYKSYSTILPNRKFWKNNFHNSFYFSIDKDDFNESRSNT